MRKSLKGSTPTSGNETLEEFGKILVTFPFAVLYHKMPDGADRKTHWDLLLSPPPSTLDVHDAAQSLITFEIPSPPPRWGMPTQVRRLPNHRNLYLAFEGKLSGNRGEVIRVAFGKIRWQVIEANLLILDISSEEPACEFFISGVLRVAKRSNRVEDQEWILTLQSGSQSKQQ